MMGESTKKINIFERVMEECSDNIEEKDLLKILDAHLDMSSRVYLQVFGALISIAVLFSQVEPIQTTNVNLIILWFVLLAIGLIILGYNLISLVTNNPFVIYNKLFVNYINARTRLRELRGLAHGEE